MYLECVLVSHGRTQADEDLNKLKTDLKLKTIAEVYQTTQYKSTFRLNQKYIDSELTATARKDTHLQDNISKYNPEVILVSPLKSAIQTCLDLYGLSQKVKIYIEPLLAPRVNSTSAIGADIDSLLNEFKVLPNRDQLQMNQHWYINYSSPSHVLPTDTNAQQECINLLSKTQELQSQSQFWERLQRVRKQLVSYYNKTHKNLMIIAHQSVLQSLTSTGCHENGKLINNISFEPGEVKSEFIWIEGVEGELENNDTPFCG